MASLVPWSTLDELLLIGTPYNKPLNLTGRLTRFERAPRRKLLALSAGESAARAIWRRLSVLRPALAGDPRRLWAGPLCGPAARAMSKPIYFFSRTDAYSELSNFAPFGFEDEEGYWPTVEHYFQAQKFSGADHADYRARIRSSRSPKDAKTLGQTRKVPIRPDWDEVKEDVMREALRRKFANPTLRDLLLATKNRPLIENSPFDRYWGAGKDGRGLNRLGVLLVELRAELRVHAA